MDKSLTKLVLGAVLGAVAAEVLRHKKPELFDEIKKDAKDIAESIYKRLRTIVRDFV